MAGRAAYLRQDYTTAIELYAALMKNFPDSGWRCDARFGEGDALSDLNKFGDALVVFDALTKDFPDCYLLSEAYGRKGDMLFTLGRFDEAIPSYRQGPGRGAGGRPGTSQPVVLQDRQVLLKRRRNSKMRSSGTARRCMSKRPRRIRNAPPERFWMLKAGLAAGGIKEQRQQWRDAIILYQKLADLCPDKKPEIDEMVRKLRVEHLILF